MIAIGIDIGGTSIKGAAITSEGKVLDVFAMPVVKGEQQEITINKLIDLLNNYLKEHGYNKDNVLGVGLGVPGTLNTQKGTVDYSNNLGWVNLPISKMISDATGLPVRITNDANAAALAEAKYGAGRKYKNIVMVTLGTGVGGGVVIDGKLFEGYQGKGAELGHMVVEIDGRECTCGRRGCLEAYVSATGLIKSTKEMMEKHPESRLQEVADKIGKVDARVAFEAARMGDKWGQDLVDNYIHYLGEGINNYLNIFRPEAIVLSGGIANEREYLNTRLFNYCRERHFGYRNTPAVDIVTSELGYDSGKIGAAALFFE